MTERRMYNDERDVVPFEQTTTLSFIFLFLEYKRVFFSQREAKEREKNSPICIHSYTITRVLNSINLTEFGLKKLPVILNHYYH